MKITLSNVSGDLKSEIGSLVRFYSVNLKRPYSQFLGKGVFGKKLAESLKESHSIVRERCDCHDNFNCCDCGGSHCGCGYCFSCNACDECLEKD